MRAAIDDAGLSAADIDGIGTLGDTPPAEVLEALGIQAEDRTTGFDTGGGAHSRHVGLPRCIGAAIATCPRLSDRCDAGRVEPGFADAQSAGLRLSSRTRSGTRRKLKPFEDIDLLVAAHSYSAANWLAMHCRRTWSSMARPRSSWAGWRSTAGATLGSIRARVPRPDDDERLPLVATRVDAIRTVRLRRTGRRSHRAGGLHADYAADCPNRPVAVEAIERAYGSGGWFHRDDFPKMASVEAAAEMWSRTFTASDVQVAELYDGFTYLTFAWLEALGFCGDGEAGPFVDGATRIALDGELPLNTYGANCPRAACTATGCCMRRACSCGARPVTASSPGDPRWPSPRREAARSPPPWC